MKYSHPFTWHSQGDKFDDVYEFGFEIASESPDDGNRALVLFHEILSILKGYYESLTSLPKKLELYFILLDCCSQMFLHKSLSDLKFPESYQIQGDDGYEATIQEVFDRAVMIPANEYELSIRIHFLIQAVTNVRNHFIEGQVRSFAATLNDCGVHVKKDGYESFCFLPEKFRAVPKAIPLDMMGTAYSNLFSDYIGQKQLYLNSGRNCSYKVYCVADYGRDDTPVLSKEQVGIANEMSLYHILQASKNTEKQFNDLFQALVHTHLLEQHPNELCVVTEHGTEKHFPTWRKHLFFLIFGILSDHYTGFNQVNEFLKNFREHVISQSKDPKVYGDVYKQSLLTSPPVASSTVADVETAQAVTNQEPWVSPDSYPEIEKATSYYFDPLDIGKSSEYFSFFGFHKEMGFFADYCLAYSSKKPAPWNDFLNYITLCVNSRNGAEVFDTILSNDGSRIEQGFPKKKFVYNSDGGAYLPKVSGL